MNRLARWTFAVPTLLCCSVVFAQHAAPTEPELLERDQVAEQLRLESLRFNAAAQAVEDDVRYPPMKRAAVYLGVELDDLLVSQVTVQIDQRPLVTINFERHEAIALLRSRGLQRLMLSNLAPGPHRIHMTLQGQFASAKEGSEIFSKEQTVEFEKQPKATSVVFRLYKSAPSRSLTGLIRNQAGPTLGAQVLREQP